MHWNLFPREMVRFGQQDVFSYPFFLVGGCVVAFHLDQVHTWVCAHARLIGAMTMAAALAAEGIYFLAAHGVTTLLGSGSDPFQPSVIPFNVAAVTCGYLAGVTLVQPRRSRQVQGRGALRLRERLRHLSVPHALHLDADPGRLGEVHPGDPVADAVPSDRGDRLRLRHGADQLCCWPDHGSRSRAAESRPGPSRSGCPSGCRGPGVCSPASSGQVQQVRIRDSY